MLEIARPRVTLTHPGVNYGRFEIEPLEPGYGITIGNSLRRILLRSLPGAAIVRVRIADVWHEFSTVEGVREDVTEIVLNLKRVRLRVVTDQFRESRASLYAQGEGVVRAGDIDWPGEVEVVNPEHVIATLDNDEAKLEMELVVARGRGYQPAEAQEIYSLGEVPVDAIFTPIEKVNYVVEHTRVGHMTDYDRLILEIVTDGTIEPADALTAAAQILVDHGRLIADFNRADAQPVEETTRVTSEADNRMLADLGLSPRVLNALRSRQIERVGQVLSMERDQLKTIRNFGPRSLEELEAALAEHGYSLDEDDAGDTDEAGDATDLTQTIDDVQDAVAGEETEE